ncbi:MAG: hypothetical protein ACREMY_07600 [bacterium]
MTRILGAMAFLLVLLGHGLAQQPAGLADLIPAADVIVVAQISEADYSRTPSDGPMIAHAKVMNALKGRLKDGQSFEFTETAWVGPSYQTGEVRLLFLESTEGNGWRILSNLYARTDFFVGRDAVPHLNENSLKSVLEKLPVPASKTVRITRDMLE